jgi:hypothetical protein
VVATLTGPANLIFAAKYFLVQVAQVGANRCKLVQALAVDCRGVAVDLHHTKDLQREWAGLTEQEIKSE